MHALLIDMKTNFAIKRSSSNNKKVTPFLTF